MTFWNFKLFFYFFRLNLKYLKLILNRFFFFNSGMNLPIMHIARVIAINILCYYNIFIECVEPQ